MSLSGVASPMKMVVRTASSMSSRPGERRPRRAASVSESRMASMMWADEQSIWCSRSSRATRDSQPVARLACGGRCHRKSYQPGAVMPAP